MIKLPRLKKLNFQPMQCLQKMIFNKINVILWFLEQKLKNSFMLMELGPDP